MELLNPHLVILDAGVKPHGDEEAVVDGAAGPVVHQVHHGRVVRVDPDEHGEALEAG